LRAGSFVSFAVKRKKVRPPRTRRFFCFPLRSLASASRRRAFYLFLDKKVAKNQGLELMSDKFVKALFRQHKQPMKIGRERAALGRGGLKDCGEALNVFSFHHFLCRVAGWP